jgi:quercetin dioxygenase-like cupin family protein
MKKNISNFNVIGDRAHNIELEKSNVHIIVEILEYAPRAVVTKTILKKMTGNISVSSFDAGEELAEKICPFDIYIQIIDGTAVVGISDKTYKLRLGEGIIIPAHTLHRFNAAEQFKMVSTIIKSGYED